VGYRVNSHQATQFRVWASQALKEHLIKGFTIYKPRLAQQGVHELQQTIELLQKTLKHHDLANDLGQEAIQLILSYAKTWSLLLAYDEGLLELPKKGKQAVSPLNCDAAIEAIQVLKSELIARNEATPLFGNDCNKGLNNILNNIEQTFDGEALYKTVEEKSAHLLYFIIKDYPFTSHAPKFPLVHPKNYN